VSPPEREEITAAAIARLAGVGRAAVSNWRKRYPGFPQPVGGSPTSPTFDRAEVVAWLKVTGKADQLATAGRTEGGTLRVGPGARKDIQKGLLSLVPGDHSRASLRQMAEQATNDRSITDLKPGELLARTMAALLPRSTVSGHHSQDDPPAVLDPACAGGVLLMAVAERFGARVRLAGQEINEGYARIAAFNLSGNANGAPYEVYTGDSFTNNQLSPYLGKAAAVVCEPSLDRPDWPIDDLTTDRRWEFGIAAPRDAELAWVQHCYAHLRPHGVAVVAVSQRTCMQPSGEHIRTALVRSGVLQTVIAMPSGMSSVPGSDICLWVLRRPSGKPDRTSVRVIDLTGLGDLADVPLEHAAWQQLLEDEDPTVVRAVERLELLDDGARLLPSRYLKPRGEASAAELQRVAGRLTRIYTAVGQRLPRFNAPTAETARQVLVSLAELEWAGALTIRARDDTPRRGDVLLRTHGRMPAVATGTTADTGIAQVVEIDQTRLDPHFVALFLRSDVAGLPVANTLGAINRDDLRRCRIPRMPLAEQRRYGDAFRWLTELEQVLTALSDLSAKVIEQTIYSLTTGTIAPEYESHDEIKGWDQ
jgi:N-6 DNA Methylase